MRHIFGLSAFSLLFFCLITIPVRAQVQTVGDVSFAVPDGWTYAPGADFGALMLKGDKTYWLMGVYTSMPSSGDPTTDMRAAWKRIVLPTGDHQGWPILPYYDITHTIGYPGKRADEASISRASYARLYILETGKSFIPVAMVSTDGMILNSKEYVANQVLSSVRLAPLKATPIKTSITITDLAVDWQSGAANSVSFYNNSTGAYQGTSNSFAGAGYHISANGSFTYKMTGVINNQSASDNDSGTIELGGEFITFKGHNHVARYRFLNIQQAINGTTVLTLLPPADMAQINIVRDSELWSKKK